MWEMLFGVDAGVIFWGKIETFHKIENRYIPEKWPWKGPRGPLIK